MKVWGSSQVPMISAGGPLMPLPNQQASGDLKNWQRRLFASFVRWLLVVGRADFPLCNSPQRQRQVLTCESRVVGVAIEALVAVIVQVVWVHPYVTPILRRTPFFKIISPRKRTTRHRGMADFANLHLLIGYPLGSSVGPATV